ncbi:MAG: hypothetical protein M9916_07360 [Crocinitomicaceae bacterium]|nr:hypothetical protein [Crocinitomicaceae bacterium]
MLSIVRYNYRYGFGSQERDNEISGKGNSYTAEFWQYSPRIVKRWNVDPMTAKYPWQSPYSVFNNNPIYYNDPLGLEGQDWIGKKDEKGRTHWEWDENVQSKDQLPDGYTEYAKPGYTYPSNGRTVQLGSGKNDWSYIDKNANGNYTNQQGMDIQWSGEDEANTMFKMKMKGLEQALDNLKLAMGATFSAPWVAGAAIVGAPAAMSVGGKMLFSTTFKVGLVKGILNSAYNFGSQLYANKGDFGAVDRASVGIAFGSGFLPGGNTAQAFKGIVATSIADGVFDYTGNDGFTMTGYGKSVLKTISDTGFSAAGSLGNNAFGTVPTAFTPVTNFVTTLPTTTLGTIVGEHFQK